MGYVGTRLNSTYSDVIPTVAKTCSSLKQFFSGAKRQKRVITSSVIPFPKNIHTNHLLIQHILYIHLSKLRHTEDKDSKRLNLPSIHQKPGRRQHPCHLKKGPGFRFPSLPQHHIIWYMFRVGALADAKSSFLGALVHHLPLGACKIYV